ncbi:hypothetical protein GGS20DRAFT_354806 [Poronia punctata]|nr:hypothetical protein GGS20DRAFT_354806 [Poronia punctata]
MKFSNAVLGLAAIAHGVNAVAVPDINAASVDVRAPAPEHDSRGDSATHEDLWKRKGGGGGGRGGGGGGSGGGRGGGGGGSGGGRGGSGNGGGGGGGGGRGGPTYGGGQYYGGGATAPYRAGQRSGSGIAPRLLAGAALGGIGFLGLAFLAGAYSYPYHHPYTYYNSTTEKNETKPVECLCDPNSPCGCDDNGDQTFFREVIGNGSYEGLNHTLVTVAKNETTGNDTIYLNGVLPNGTSVDNGAAGSMTALVQAGWWPAATMGLVFAFLL